MHLPYFIVDIILETSAFKFRVNKLKGQYPQSPRNQEVSSLPESTWHLCGRDGEASLKTGAEESQMSQVFLRLPDTCSVLMGTYGILFLLVDFI